MTDHLDLLAQMLEVVNSEKPFSCCNEIDDVLKDLENAAKNGRVQAVPVDLQQEAVRRFFTTQSLVTLRDTRLTSFGMCIPVGPEGTSVIDDRQLFSGLLNGVDRWVDEPRRYRRCYQGLLANYFEYDIQSRGVSDQGKRNWLELRSYLGDRSGRIRDKGLNPDWVTCLSENEGVLGEMPCDAYAAAALRGDMATVDRVRQQLSVAESSWFARELLMAQVHAAVNEPDAPLEDLLPALLQRLELSDVLRDRGLVLLLDRWARTERQKMLSPLRDCAVRWWGNPWIPSNDMRWGAVARATRDMVAEWLKLEFVESFFTLLAEEGSGDRRRLNFWKRYVKSIDHIEFALGGAVRASQNRDLVALLKKMEGLKSVLADPIATNNAFVMTMGNLVAVEFSGEANALYGYDSRKGLPFNLGKALVTTKDVGNSLKSSKRSLWLKHSDGQHGYDRWEERFEVELRKTYSIEPSEGQHLGARIRAPRASASQPVAPKSVVRDGARGGLYASTYSLAELARFSRDRGLKVEDRTGVGGNLWVVTKARTVSDEDVLRRWGFRFKQGKGWWK